MPTVKETFEFLPDPQKPSYYVFIWGSRHGTSPTRPQQVFRADTWLEAQNFARVFASLTMLQYATAIALAPKVPDEMGGHGEELARENYWQESKGNISFDRYTMPVERVEQLQKEFPEGAAYEIDMEERLRKVKELMKDAKPGDTLADVLARKWDRERQTKAVEKVKGLFRHGDYSKKQGRLRPLRKPRKGLVKAYEKEGKLWDEVPQNPRFKHSENVTVKGKMQVMYNLDEAGRLRRIATVFHAEGAMPTPAYQESELGTFVYEWPIGPSRAKDDAKIIIDYLKSGYDYVDLYYEAMRNGLTDQEYTDWINHIGIIPITTGQYVFEWTIPEIPLPLQELAAGVPVGEIERRERERIPQEGQSRLAPPSQKLERFRHGKTKESESKQTTFAFEIGGKKYSRFHKLPMAFESEGSGWDTKIGNPRGFFTLRQWAIRNKKTEAGTAELEGYLQEAKTSAPDLTASEARGKVEFADEPNDHPWIDLHGSIDFETIEEKARMAEAGAARLEELKKELDELVAAKVITREQAKDTLVGLEREKLPSKQKQMLESTISALQRQLAEARVPPPKQKFKLGQKVQYLGKPDYEIVDADLQGRAWVYTVRRIGMPGEFIARDSELKPAPDAPIEEKVPREAWEGVISVLNREYDNMTIDGRTRETFIGNLANWIEENVKAGRRTLAFGPGGEVAQFDLLTGTLRTKERIWEKVQEELAHRGSPIISMQPAPAPPKPPQVMPEARQPRVRIEMPKVVEPARKFSEPEIQFLDQAFKTIISRKLRRDPFPAELNEFDKLVQSLEAMSPPLKFSMATRRIEDLARGLAAKGTPGRIVVRRGQSRVNELMEKSLRGPLTEDEKDELERLEGRPPEEIFEREEVYYESPKIKIIADSGPVPPTGGAPMEHGKDYPRLLGAYWRIEIAELNAANFERKGFKTRLEQEK